MLFSSDSRALYDRADMDRIEPMTDELYQAGGCIALPDAAGGAVRHIGNVHKYAREEDRPAKTVFVITTDGYKNSSRHCGDDQVQRIIKRQQERYGWEFLFPGADMDTIAAARSFGIREDRG